MSRNKALLFLLLACPNVLLAQGLTSHLEVFGYFQVGFDNSIESTTILGQPKQTSVRNTFILQQANIFLRKQFTPTVSSFLDLEFTNTYSSSRGWGSFRVEEAWVMYEPREYFAIRGGLLVPAFNNLNEIKNRMPLLPYITRPLVYEAAIEGAANFDEFTPGSAFLQIQGMVHVGEAKLDYALYTGNGDPAFTTTNATSSTPFQVGGMDTTTFKLFGIRVGTRIGKVKAGFSFTRDYVNRNLYGIGSVPRVRFGGDLSGQLGPFSLESEVIATQERLDDRQTALYNTAARMNPLLGSKPSNFFAYGVLLYDFSEEFYAYGGVEYLEYHGSDIARGFMVGGAFVPLDQLVFKVQYLYLDNEFFGLSAYHSDRIQVAISLMF